MPGGYYFKALGQFADYRTRARRAEFWTYTIVAWLLEIFVFALTATVVNSAIDADTRTLHLDAVTPVGWVFLAATGATTVFVLVPFAAVAVRRMHDLGRSGWWALFLLFLPIVTYVMALFDGQPMTNKYGVDPKGRGLS